MMLISTVFNSIDGEVNYYGQGMLTTFIRLQGCNLSCSYCFGVRPGRRNPKITIVNGPNKKLTEVKVGDELATFNESGTLVPTKVIDTTNRTVMEWIELKVNDTLYFVTKEHPFFTNKGLVLASELTVDHEILHSTPNQKISLQKQIYNPMHNPEIAERSSKNTNYVLNGKRISETVKQKQQSGVYKSPWNLLSEDKKDQVKQKISVANSGSNNGNWTGGKQKNYIKLKKAVKIGIHRQCQKCGEFTTKLDIHHEDGNRLNDNAGNLKIVCESCHYSLHQVGYNFWKSERIDGKQMVVNGFKIQSIKTIQSKKPLTVYNLTCSPYNSYLVDNMWVHNCDTTHAQDKTKALFKMTPTEIVKEVHLLQGNKVTITGGEPLEQKKELIRLVEIFNRTRGYDFRVTIETNGSKSLKGISDMASWVVDYKLPSSGMERFMNHEAFCYLGRHDVVKFVIQTKEDFNKATQTMEEIWNDFNLQDEFPVFAFSPVFKKLTPIRLLSWLTETSIPKQYKTALNIQLHKIIGLP